MNSWYVILISCKGTSIQTLLSHRSSNLDYICKQISEYVNLRRNDTPEEFHAYKTKCCTKHMYSNKLKCLSLKKNAVLVQNNMKKKIKTPAGFEPATYATF